MLTTSPVATKKLNAIAALCRRVERKSMDNCGNEDTD